MNNDQQNVTFKTALDYVSKVIPNYRRIIFKTIVTYMVICKDRKRIACIVRNFAAFFFHSKSRKNAFTCSWLRA